MLKRIEEMIEKYKIQNENAKLNYHSKQWKYHIRRLGIYNDILSDLEELKKLREEELKVNKEKELWNCQKKQLASFRNGMKNMQIPE
jgi:hypothetical protein